MPQGEKQRPWWCIQGGASWESGCTKSPGSGRPAPGWRRSSSTEGRPNLQCCREKHSVSETTHIRLLWIHAGPKTALRCVKSRPSLSSRGHFKTDCLNWVNYAHQEVTRCWKRRKQCRSHKTTLFSFHKTASVEKPEATTMNSFKWVHLTILKKSFAQTFSKSFLYWPFFKRPCIIAFHCFSGHTGSPEQKGSSVLTSVLRKHQKLPSKPWWISTPSLSSVMNISQFPLIIYHVAYFSFQLKSGTSG